MQINLLKFIVFDQKGNKNDYKRSGYYKSARCKDHPGSVMGSRNVKHFEWGYLPLKCSGCSDSSLANSGSIVVTTGLLTAMAIIFVGPILMSALTVMLKSPVSRWANRIIGIIYAVVVLAFWILGFVLQRPGYEIVLSTAQLVFALLAVWYAWKWPNPESWPLRRNR